MAVNIDTVYQRVLALANKEQRGYITPQEFNLFANQAQMDIFEQYFYDINQYATLNNIEEDFADTVEMLQEKIDYFEQRQSLSSNQLPSDLYRLGLVLRSHGGEEIIVDKVSRSELKQSRRSPLTMPSVDFPVYFLEGSKIFVHYSSGVASHSNVEITYVRKPSFVEWGYNVVVGKALYNTGASTDFELHSSEETKLVVKILQLAGITINKPGLMEVASQKEASKLQQQKS